MTCGTLRHSAGHQPQLRGGSSDDASSAVVAQPGRREVDPGAYVGDLREDSPGVGLDPVDSAALDVAHQAVRPPSRTDSSMEQLGEGGLKNVGL